MLKFAPFLVMKKKKHNSWRPAPRKMRVFFFLPQGGFTVETFGGKRLCGWIMLFFSFRGDHSRFSSLHPSKKIICLYLIWNVYLWHAILRANWETCLKHDNCIVKISLMPTSLIILTTLKNLIFTIYLSLLLL